MHTRDNHKYAANVTGLLEDIDIWYGIIENTFGRNHIYVTNLQESTRVSLKCIWELTPKRNHINTASMIKLSPEKVNFKYI